MKNQCSKTRQLLLLIGFYLISIHLSYSQIRIFPSDIPCDAQLLCDYGQSVSFFFDMKLVPTEYSLPEQASCYCHDPNWIAFVAGDTQAVVTLDIADCHGGTTGLDALQFSAYKGNPMCSSSGVTGLNLILGDCNDPLQEGSYTYTISTIEDSIYYLIFDGWNGSLCGVSITIQGLKDTVFIDSLDVYPQEISLPEFQGSDTICEGANIDFCIDSLPEGANCTVWTLSGSNEFVRSRLGSRCIPYDKIFKDTMPVDSFTLCVAAGNGCYISEFNCRTYYMGEMPPVIYHDTIYEGESYDWVFDTINTEDLEPGLYTFSNITYSQSGCKNEVALELYVDGRGATQINKIICYGDIYSFDVNPSTSVSFTTSQPVSDIDYVDVSPTTGNDTLFNISIDMVGGVFIPVLADCDHSGTITFYNSFVKPFNEILDLDDPRIQVEVEWYNASADILLSVGEQCVLTEAQLKELGDFTLVSHVVIHYGNQFAYTCAFVSIPYTFNRERWIPKVIAPEGPIQICRGSSVTFTVTVDFLGTLFYQGFKSLPYGVDIEYLLGDEIKLIATSEAESGTACFLALSNCGFGDERCIMINIPSADPLEVTIFSDSTVEITGGAAPYDTTISLVDDKLQVIVIDANGCRATDFIILTDVENSTLSQFIVYPNPVTDILRIETGDLQQYKLILYNQLGNKLLKKENVNDINLSPFAPGVYYLQISTNQFGKHRVERIPVVILR